MPGVIYQIVIRGGSRTYIGSAAVFHNRKRAHLGMLRRGNHHCIGLRRAVAKYGMDAVSWVILEEVSDHSLLLVREQAWIDRFWGRLYNASPSASSILGFKKTAEQREKSAHHHRGKVVSAETRKKIGRALRGNTNGRHGAKPVCGKGHPMSGDNLYTYTIASGAKRRACRICQAENNARQHARRYPRKDTECLTS
jgi:group I intron endonuclease